MVIRTYFDKNNTIVNNSRINTGLNPVAELFYGGQSSSQSYSRFLFHFDESRIREMYTGGTFTDLSKLTHTLRMTNTSSFDTGLLNTDMNGKKRASSFDLLLFKIDQEWDNGVGYDLTNIDFNLGDSTTSIGPSNWFNPKIGYDWNNGLGVYSGSPVNIIIGTQHMDKGNENIEIDITEYVNGILLSGQTNYGLGIAFHRGYEELLTPELQYVGFFTNNTQTFFEPFIETVYSNHIKDDRNDFYLDKHNKLYLYVNIAGNPVNLDFKPSVSVYDNCEVLLSGYSGGNVTHVTKGVYSINVLIPSNGSNEGVMYNDIWSNISINGVARPDITLDVVTKDSMEYYNIGNNDSLPKKIGVSISGVKNNDKIKRGDIRKVLVSARIPYTVEQTQKISDLKYRLYVKEGSSELTVIDYQPIEMANNHYYFLLDTASLIPNTYYLDILVTSNLEVTTIKENIRFDIINQVELRKAK